MTLQSAGSTRHLRGNENRNIIKSIKYSMLYFVHKDVGRKRKVILGQCKLR